MARVVWTREALSQLELIREYVEQFDPAAARRLTNRLVAAGESLCNFPKRGRIAGDAIRELPTIRPYIIQYEVHVDIVYILRIRHSAQSR